MHLNSAGALLALKLLLSVGERGGLEVEPRVRRSPLLGVVRLLEALVEEAPERGARGLVALLVPAEPALQPARRDRPPDRAELCVELANLCFERRQIRAR